MEMRKTIEKNRRFQMKFLSFRLVSLLPPNYFDSPKEFISTQDQIGIATDYIKNLSARVEELRRKKGQLAIAINGNVSRINTKESLPIVRVKELGSSLEVVLICGLRKKVVMHQVIRVLEEEGTEVINTSLCSYHDKIFHTLHAQVKVPRIGVDSSRICERLEELIQ